MPTGILLGRTKLLTLTPSTSQVSSCTAPGLVAHLEPVEHAPEMIITPGYGFLPAAASLSMARAPRSMSLIA